MPLLDSSKKEKMRGNEEERCFKGAWQDLNRGLAVRVRCLKLRATGATPHLFFFFFPRQTPAVCLQRWLSSERRPKQEQKSSLSEVSKGCRYREK